MDVPDDIVRLDVVVYNKAFDVQDDIVGLDVVDHSVVVYNSHYWRRFDLKVKNIYSFFKYEY